MLGLSQEELVQLPAVAQGRVLGSAAQEKLDGLLFEDEDLCCPVMLVLFQDPVIASDGFIYERTAVETLIQTNRPSPMTREPFGKTVYKARQKAQDANRYREKMVKELIKFADECNDAGLASAALERATDYLIFLKPRNYIEDTHAVVRSWQKHGKPVPNGLLNAPPSTSEQPPVASESSVQPPPAATLRRVAPLRPAPPVASQGQEPVQQWPLQHLTRWW